MAAEFRQPVFGATGVEEGLIGRCGGSVRWGQDFRQIGQIPRREWFARGQRGG